MSSWIFPLQLDPRSRQPLSVQIAQAIATDIRRGRLRAGDSLPGSRTLARTLRVSRNTVSAAYQELQAQGWVTIHGPRGTRVSDALPEPTARDNTRHSARARAAIGFDLEAAEIGAWTAFRSRRGVMRWDFGVPDVRLVPTKPLARAFRRVLHQRSHRSVLNYNIDGIHAQGQSKLSHCLIEMLARTRGMSVNQENLIIVRGSQMALYLLARSLIRPGDVIAVEHPGYFVAWPIFRMAGARVEPIAVDEDGICIDELRSLLQRDPIRAVLVTPHHQFPTTVPMSPERRRQLLRLARDCRFAIIEDDYDHDFHYQGRPVAPLATLDHGDVVVYLSSLSKLFAPGIRIGYLVAPVPLIERIRRLRFHLELQGDYILEETIAELFEEGEMQRHLNRARRVYLARRDHLVALLRQRLGHVLDFHTPAGGLALWVRVCPDIDIDAWSHRALAHGLAVLPRSCLYMTGCTDSCWRLGFGMLNEAEQITAVARLTRSLDTMSASR